MFRRERSLIKMGHNEFLGDSNWVTRYSKSGQYDIRLYSKHARPLSTKKRPNFPSKENICRSCALYIDVFGGIITANKLWNFVAFFLGMTQEQQWLMRNSRDKSSRAASDTVLWSRIDHFLSLQAAAGLLLNSQQDREHLLQAGEYRRRIARRTKTQKKPFAYYPMKPVSVTGLRKLIEYREKHPRVVAEHDREAIEVEELSD
jgi:hypothetical protein